MNLRLKIFDTSFVLKRFQNQELSTILHATGTKKCEVFLGTICKAPTGGYFNNVQIYQICFL